jgi:A118 family predicted phage portal protein
MPLPPGNTLQEWPPKEFKDVNAKFAEHSAWYSGDPNQIANVQQSMVYTPTPRGRHWAKDLGEERRVMLHIPIAGDIASVSSDLLFSEAPRILIPDAHIENASSSAKKTQDRLEDIINHGGIYNRLIEAAEVGAALGGVYIKPNWDASLCNFPILSLVQADSAIPVFKWGFLHSVTFWKTIEDEDDVVWRLLECHEVGVILNGLYKGTRDTLGIQVGLDAHPATKGMLPRIDTGLQTIAVRYIPNKRPNRVFRGSALGQSDYAGCEGLFDALDEVWTSWIRDIRLGQGRITVPEMWLERDELGRAKFDVDREIYTSLDVDPISAQGMGAIVNQFEIRTEEHKIAAMELIDRIVTTAGYSPQSFGLNIEGRAESGTALNIRERKSMMTKGKKERFFKSAVEDVLEMMLFIDREVFKSGIDPMRPNIDFQDSSSFDLESVSKSVELVNRAQAASIRTRIAMVHPDWTKEQIEQEAKAILAETGVETADESDLPV